ncbi:MAG: ABC transporter substrate-binding protein [Oscillospiraceae bacterium]|nr:ABC transporter substrate-binding protein [Oscillospiraceae bacterium]
MKKFCKILALLMVMILSVSALTGCSKSSTNEIKYDANGNPILTGHTFKLGLVSSLADNTGRLHQEVINLFLDKWNKEGTLFGAKVELVAYDNLNNGAQDTEMSIKSVQKLINSDKVQVVIPGQLSNIIQSVGSIINDAKVLGLGLGLSATWMEQGWNYIYRPALNNNYQVPSVTATMKSLNQQNIAILYENTDNCLTFRDSLKAAAQKDGINVVSEEMLASSGGTGITGQITNAINSNPDAIFVTAMGGGFGTVIKQLRQSGYKGMIYIGQILITTEVDSIGDEEVNGVVMCSPYVSYENYEDCTNDYVKSCLKTFYDKYGYCPTDDQFYKMWDAMLLIENAVLAAKSIEPEKIQAAISSLKFEGTAGTMDFTQGTNECYFGARAWVYTGQGAAGAPVVLEDWLESDLAKKVVITNQQ